MNCISIADRIKNNGKISYTSILSLIVKFASKQYRGFIGGEDQKALYYKQSIDEVFNIPENLGLDRDIDFLSCIKYLNGECIFTFKDLFFSIENLAKSLDYDNSDIISHAENISTITALYEYNYNTSENIIKYIKNNLKYNIDKSIEECNNDIKSLIEKALIIVYKDISFIEALKIDPNIAPLVAALYESIIGVEDRNTENYKEYILPSISLEGNKLLFQLDELIGE